MGSRRRASGLTLIELMIGILVGLILMSAVISVYVASIRSNSAVLTMAQLNHEVRSVAEIVANDIRRAGFDNATSTRSLADLQNDYDRIAISSILRTGDCVRFGYNRSAAAEESFGFRRVEEGVGGIGVVEMKVAADNTTCETWGSSNSAALTDERRVNITEFRLSTSDPSLDLDQGEGSRCFNLPLREHGKEQSLDDWSWLGLSTDTTIFPCDRADLADLPKDAGTKTRDGHLLVEHRQLFLTVTGQATHPAGRAGAGQPLQTRITTEIRVPNNRRLLANVSPE